MPALGSELQAGSGRGSAQGVPLSILGGWAEIPARCHSSQQPRKDPGSTRRGRREAGEEEGEEEQQATCVGRWQSSSTAACAFARWEMQHKLPWDLGIANTSQPPGKRSQGAPTWLPRAVGAARPPAGALVSVQGAAFGGRSQGFLRMQHAGSSACASREGPASPWDTELPALPCWPHILCPLSHRGITPGWF